MAKNNVLKKALEAEDDFDFDECLDHDHHASDMIGGLIELEHNQMILAMELAKLVVENTSDKNLNTDNIFSIFKNAKQVISESSSLKNILEDLSK